VSNRVEPYHSPAPNGRSPDHPAFERIGVDELREYNAHGLWFRHRATGCEVYHVANDDPDKLFAFVFKTVPPDSSGVAHILEHTVLCGSRRYPLKDPFVRMMQGSMYTFLNALTFPDKTVYPAGSTVTRDLFNLMSVYGDAVFFPLLTEDMFRQEGHRLELDQEGRLRISGVVYNEMQGAYSTHDAIAGERAIRSLFPDTPYGLDSGGDPRHIPELTYEAFRDYHARYYHPSNARIFLYGDLPVGDCLSFLEEQFLGAFSAKEVSAEVPLQPRWQEPRPVMARYPAEGSGEEAKSSVTLNWLLGSVDDPSHLISMEALGEALLGTSGAPLYQALIESELGEDLSGPTGLENELRELVLSAGLRGTDPARAEEIEACVLDALRNVRDRGLGHDVVEGTLRKLEFRNRERRGVGNGLRLLRRASRGWLHGHSPAATLRFTEPYRELRRRAESEGSYFERLVDELLVQNGHRTTLTVVPDSEPAEGRRAESAERLARMRESLSEPELHALQERQKRLERIQQEPDSPEALAALPSLDIQDLPREVERIEYERRSLPGDGVLLTHDLFTNAIVYIDLALDVSGVPDRLRPLLPLLAEIVTETGLPDIDYAEVARRLSLHTGGVRASVDVAEPLPGGLARPREGAALTFQVRFKALERSLEEGWALLRRLLVEADLTDRRRVRDILYERRNELKSALVPGGTGFTATRAAAQLSPAEAIEDELQGFGQLFYLSGIDAHRDLDSLIERLSQLRRWILTRAHINAAVAGSGVSLARAEELVGELSASLTGNEGADGAGDAASDGSCEVPGRPHAGGDAFPSDAFRQVRVSTVRPVQCFRVPSEVSYVSAATRGARLGTREHAHEMVLAHILRTGRLWERIRMQGGAYGATASTNGLTGVFVFGSYRDPDIVATFRSFREVCAEYGRTPPDESEIVSGVIGTVGREVRPFSPGEKNMVSLKRALYGVGDDLRQRRREALLATGPDDIARRAAALRDGLAASAASVLGGAEAVERALREVRQLSEPIIDVPL